MKDLYPCAACDKQFSCISKLKEHLIVHIDIYPYTCDTCGKQFKRINTLKDHLTIHSNERPYSCNECDATFKTSNCLTSHKKIHSNIRPYNCEICNKSFKSKHEVKIHQEIHTNNQYICKFCNKVYKRAEYLQFHCKINHFNNEVYTCEVCNKEFKTSYIRNKHIKEVHQDINHVCNFIGCEKSYKRESELITHQRIHFGLYPYPCKVPGCTEGFNSRWALNAHKNKQHIDIYLFHKCEEENCGLIFNTEAELKNHKLIHIPRIKYKCDICNKLYLYKDSCLHHLRTIHKIFN